MTDLERSIVERKKLDAEHENSRGSWVKDYEDIKCCSYESENRKIFRLIGKPPEVREKPTDAKVIKFSRWVRDDLNGYAEIVWKTDDRENLDETWFLYRFMKDVMKSTYKEYTKEEKENDPTKRDKKGEWILDNVSSPVCQRLERNKSRRSQYGASYYPTDLVLINVLDRNDTWCTDNSHTKLFVKRLDTWQDAKTGDIIEKANEPGITKTLYRQIVELFINSACKTWSDKDFAIKKIDKKGNVWLSIRDNIPDLGTSQPLSETELKYERYNIDKIKPVTSYSKIMRCWGKLIKAWDVETNSDYYEELEVLVAEEKARIQTQNVEKEEKIEEKSTKVEESKGLEPKIEENKSIEPEVKNEPIKEESVVRQRIPVKSETKIKPEDIFPKFNELSDADKKIIRDNFEGIDYEKKEILWNKDISIGFCTNENCIFELTGKKCITPIDLKQCPNCSRVFQDDLN